MNDRHFNTNPYYSPELCGLKQVDLIEEQPDYDFHMVVVWQDITSKRYYFAADSGCSCPSPFEDFHNLSQLGKLNKTNFKNFEDAVNNLSQVDSSVRSRFLSKWRRKFSTSGKQ